MKLIRLFALLLLMSLTACSKDKKEIEEGLRLTVDGKEIFFAFFTEAEYDSTGGIHNLTILAADTEKKPNVVTLNVTQAKPIASGPYIHPDPNQDFFVTMDWSPSGEDPTDPYYAGLDGADPMSITITSIEADRVQGTFQGTVRRADGATKSISGGSFNLALK